MAGAERIGHWRTRRGQDRRSAACGRKSEAVLRKCPNGRCRKDRALADTTRAQPRRTQSFFFDAPSAKFTATWLGSLTAHSAVTRTRAPKRATGTFFSLCSCPVRASANTIPKKEAPSCWMMLLFWSGRRGSNSLPRPWQGRALPDELRPQNGASGRGRTGDTRIFSPLLYQLSYRGIWRPRRGSNPRPPA